jgi:hypothetical protein
MVLLSTATYLCYIAILRYHGHNIAMKNIAVVEEIWLDLLDASCVAPHLLILPNFDDIMKK